jgi:hypothetical protein
VRTYGKGEVAMLRSTGELLGTCFCLHGKLPKSFPTRKEFVRKVEVEHGDAVQTVPQWDDHSCLLLYVLKLLVTLTPIAATRPTPLQTAYRRLFRFRQCWLVDISISMPLMSPNCKIQTNFSICLCRIFVQYIIDQTVLGARPCRSSTISPCFPLVYAPP